MFQSTGFSMPAHPMSMFDEWNLPYSSRGVKQADVYLKKVYGG